MPSPHWSGEPEQFYLRTRFETADRLDSLRNGVTMITTMTAARVAVQAIAAVKAGGWGVTSLQDYAAATTAAK